MNQQVDWNTKISEVIQNQFRIKPKQQTPMYRVPYPIAYDAIPYPHRYGVLDFTKFCSQDDTSTVESTKSSFNVASQHALMVRLFSMSLSGSAFCLVYLVEIMAQLSLEPMPATFEKREEQKRRHLKALFLKGHDDGKPTTKMLVDGGVAINITLYAMFRKLWKSDEDLTKTNMILRTLKEWCHLLRGHPALI